MDDDGENERSVEVVVALGVLLKAAFPGDEERQLQSCGALVEHIMDQYPPEQRPHLARRFAEILVRNLQ